MAENSITLHLFLILDGHSVHKSKKVKEFVTKTDGLLRIFILPPYSPHLNPDEWVWSCVEKAQPWKSDSERARSVQGESEAFMRRLQKLTNVLTGFYRDPNLLYITA